MFVEFSRSRNVDLASKQRAEYILAGVAVDRWVYSIVVGQVQVEHTAEIIWSCRCGATPLHALEVGTLS